MSYEAKDIITLSQGRAFREKIGMYLSGDRQEAINLGLRELINIVNQRSCKRRIYSKLLYCLLQREKR